MMRQKNRFVALAITLLAGYLLTLIITGSPALAGQMSPSGMSHRHINPIIDQTSASDWASQATGRTRIQADACTNIYTRTTWVIRTCPSDPNVTTPMTVTLDGVSQGAAALIQIHHKSESTGNLPQVAVIYATGFVRLKQNADSSPAAPFGASGFLGPIYWDEQDTHHANLQIEALHLDTSRLPLEALVMTATARNQAFDILYQMILPPPTDFETKLHVTQTYTAQSAITIEVIRHQNHEGFKLAGIATMYVNEGGTCSDGQTTYQDCHDSDSVVYVDQNQLAQKVALDDVIRPGFIFSVTRPLGKSWVDMRHTDDAGWQGNTPNIRLRLDGLPAEDTITPQGWVSDTSDPYQQNVSLWLHDDRASIQQWAIGQSDQISYWFMARDNTFPNEPECPRSRQNTVCVIDEQGDPVAGAMLYYQGDLLTDQNGKPQLTDEDGALQLENLQPGNTVAALYPVYEQPTNKTAHNLDEGNNFAFRVYQTSLPLTITDRMTGQVNLNRVTNGDSATILHLSPDNTLVLFNVVASVEWEAKDNYIAGLKAGLRKASDMLYDATDGQMAFGWVTVYDDKDAWHEADIQVRVHNHTRPYAYIGGISTDDSNRIIYRGITPEPGHIVLGRYWNGYTGSEGDWSAYDGYSTIAHEFAHYALFLFDEYFYLYEQGDLLLRLPSRCTTNDQDPASLMYFSYISNPASDKYVPNTEFCNRQEHYPESIGGPPTRQTQVYGGEEHSWVTIKGVYSDVLQSLAGANSPAWNILAPQDRGRPDLDFVRGPKQPPLDWPSVEDKTTNSPPNCTPELTLVNDQNQYLWGASISVKRSSDSKILTQGRADKDGKIEILGADRGDIVRAHTPLNALAGELVIENCRPQNFVLNPLDNTTEFRLRNQTESSNDTFLVTMIPGANDDTIIYQVDTTADSEATIHLSLEDHPKAPSRIGEVIPHPSPSEPYRLEVPGFQPGTIFGLKAWLMITHTDGQVSTLLIGIGHDRAWVSDANESWSLTSADGNASLEANPGTLDESMYIIINPTNALPAPLPTTSVVVGDSYAITQQEGTPPKTKKPMVLTLKYQPDSLGNVDETSLQPFYWDAGRQQWAAVMSYTKHLTASEISSSIDTFGIYVLAGQKPGPDITSMSRVQESKTFLIQGENFEPGVQLLLVKDTPVATLPTTFIDSQAINAVMPSGLPGRAYSATLRNPDGIVGKPWTYDQCAYKVIPCLYLPLIYK